MAYFIKSERGKEKLAFEGYIYVKHRQNDVGIIFWECEKKRSNLKCRGRVTTQGMAVGTQVNVTQLHVDHAPSLVHVEASTIRGNIRTQSAVTRDGPRTVVNECIAGASDASIVSLPKISSMEQSVSRKRKIQGVHANINSKKIPFWSELSMG